MSRIMAEAGHMCRGSVLLERLLFLLPPDTAWAQTFFVSHHDGCKDAFKAFLSLSRILVLKHEPIDYRSHVYLPTQSIPWRQDKFPSCQSRVFKIWPMAFFPPVTPRHSKKQPQPMSCLFWRYSSAFVSLYFNNLLCESLQTSAITQIHRGPHMQNFKSRQYRTELQRKIWPIQVTGCR